MVIVFALLAALSNAVNEATQHIASTAAPPKSSGWRLVVYLFRSPLWLFGWVALIAAFVFQALALAKGQLSIVQPVLATELVFMLVLRRVWIGQSIRPITWSAAAVTCAGLAVFIAAREPGGDTRFLEVADWRPLLEFSQGNPGAILSLLEMATHPKYRSADHIKITPLYLDFRLNWKPGGVP